MAIEQWIDAVVGVAGSVASHTGGTVKAFRVASRAEIPDALSKFPCAVVYAPRMKSAQYSVSMCKEIWEVKGYFYLYANTDKSHIPEIMRYFTRIRNASLASMTLGGLVDHFRFADTDPMVMGALNYEVDSPDRHVIEVTWEVKVDVSGEVNPGV